MSTMRKSSQDKNTKVNRSFLILSHQIFWERHITQSKLQRMIASSWRSVKS